MELTMSGLLLCIEVTLIWLSFLIDLSSLLIRYPRHGTFSDCDFTLLSHQPHFNFTSTSLWFRYMFLDTETWHVRGGIWEDPGNGPGKASGDALEDVWESPGKALREVLGSLGLQGRLGWSIFIKGQHSVAECTKKISSLQCVFNNITHQVRSKSALARSLLEHRSAIGTKGPLKQHHQGPTI